MKEQQGKSVCLSKTVLKIQTFKKTAPQVTDSILPVTCGAVWLKSISRDIPLPVLAYDRAPIWGQIGNAAVPFWGNWIPPCRCRSQAMDPIKKWRTALFMYTILGKISFLPFTLKILLHGKNKVVHISWHAAPRINFILEYMIVRAADWVVRRVPADWLKLFHRPASFQKQRYHYSICGSLEMMRQNEVGTVGDSAKGF